MIRQLRIYEIFDDTKAAFHERFRDHVKRIMARHDFHFVAGWESSNDGNPEFLYLLEWPDEEAMDAGWKAMSADEEWATIRRETTERNGPMVGRIENRILTEVDYLPY